jgi:hypothetical protein
MWLLFIYAARRLFRDSAARRLQKTTRRWLFLRIHHRTLFSNLVLPAVASTAQGQQVIFGVIAAATASIDVMDVQLGSATAPLTAPTIAR